MAEVDEPIDEHAARPDDPYDEGVSEEEAEARRRRRRRVRDTVIAVILIILAIVVVDWLVRRGPGEHDFARRNIECLVCHEELLDQFRMSTVHDPFADELCTSCHTPHGERVRERSVGGDFSAWEWLHRRLDRFYLDILWRVFTTEWVVPDAPPGGAGVSDRTVKGPDSQLVAPKTELCWTCHAGLAPERAMAYQHEPFRKNQCVSCHHPHASPVKTLLHEEERELCPSCHRIQPELADPQVHPPFARIQCTSCHKPHASDWRGVLVAQERELCFSCHPSVARLTAKRVQHEPFEIGYCTDCHRPHSSDALPLLVESRPELCYLCHEVIRSDFRLASRHPLDEIGCEGCHLPHAADHQAVLHDPQPRLCFDCHPDLEDQLARPVLHQPFEQDVCTSGCHLPHGSRHDPLLQDGEPPLCYGCHPSIAADFELPSAHPVAGRLRCTDCHEAHASYWFGLLVAGGNDLCATCHEDVDGIFRASLHNPLLCLECHKGHGSWYEPILQLPNPEVCLQCHPTYADRPYYHPTRPVYWDWYAEEPLTCSSTCHNPHGGPNHHMLRVPYGQRGFGTDHVCLLCHEGVGIWY